MLHVLSILLSIIVGVLFSGVTFSKELNEVSAAKKEKTITRWMAYNELTPLQLNELEVVYNRAFQTIYKEYLSDGFLQELSNNFTSAMDDFKQFKETTFLHIAQQKDRIVGFALFQKINDNDVSLDLICIDPTCWRQGVGKQLIFPVKEQCPDVSTIKVVTYKINTQSPKFYEALGFKKTDWVDSHYKQEDIQGFEYQLLDV